MDDKTQGEIAEDEESGESNPTPLQAREHPAALPGTDNVFRRFNRNTTSLAMGVLGSLVFAALVLALQERHPKTADQAKEETQTSNEAFVKANSGTLSKGVGLNARTSTGEIASGQASSVDQAFGTISPEEVPPMETLRWGRTAVAAATPQLDQSDQQVNASLQSSVAIRGKIHNIAHGSSVRFRFTDVKRRLIELWHQSLARTENSRSGAPFSNANKGERKRVGYMVETNH